MLIQDYSFFQGIRNDLKNVMKQIEEQLHIIHTQGKNSLCEVMEYEVSHGSAIAEITSVVADSPADEAVRIVMITSDK